MAIVKLHLVQTLDELDPLYRIGAEAWRDDACFNWFFPGGRDHFEDLIPLWKGILQAYFLERGKFIVVATVHSDEDKNPNTTKKEEEVVGFAAWERKGTSDAARRWQGTSLSKKIRRLYLSVQNGWRLFFHPSRRSISVRRLMQLEREIELAQNRQPTESWYLCLLGVDPKAQRMGVGRKLLEWGINRSEEEKIPAGLEATQAGLPLYQKMGFKQNGWMYFDNGQQKQQVMTRFCFTHSHLLSSNAATSGESC
ncbi:hypothetical protein BO78DRAFT_443455 [Aspergillus sclerotiicarbonarius CBS 121057]|uniref:N-acetyltransferase domain-containing protein n=1 Tax=Aspergillus sclerotiicarbonarius (strain CBS 121057 / IBT 28362) TaxID=1448318 RepID=A0A319EKK2_ASPSB|nr:hypothetical protein BO78DRAFT_443455 [Aspergillus sclerotiicarbonarius CBS 121057]